MIFIIFFGTIGLFLMLRSMWKSIGPEDEDTGSKKI